MNESFSPSFYSCWSAVSAVATVLYGLGAPDVPLIPHSKKPPNTTAFPVLLPSEDLALKGYQPLSEAHSIPLMCTTEAVNVVSNDFSLDLPY